MKGWRNGGTIDAHRKVAAGYLGIAATMRMQGRDDLADYAVELAQRHDPCIKSRPPPRQQETPRTPVCPFGLLVALGVVLLFLGAFMVGYAFGRPA